jgi:alpha-L-fucosidase 2
MKNHSLYSFAFYLVIALLMTGCHKKQSEILIWSDKQATYFEEAFPLGNGFEGVMVKGGAPSEDMILNESTLWAGAPVNANMNPDAWKNLEGVRKALFSEDYRLAEKLVRKMQGSFSSSYAPLGNLKIDMNHGDSVQNYRRTLDLSTGVASVTYG